MDIFIDFFENAEVGKFGADYIQVVKTEMNGRHHQHIYKDEGKQKIGIHLFIQKRIYQ